MSLVSPPILTPLDVSMKTLRKMVIEKLTRELLSEPDKMPPILVLPLSCLPPRLGVLFPHFRVLSRSRRARSHPGLTFISLQQDLLNPVYESQDLSGKDTVHGPGFRLLALMEEGPGQNIHSRSLLLPGRER